MRLVLSGPAGAGVKGKKELHGLIGIEKAELLPGFPKLCMEPVSFRGIEMDFGFVEKVLVILHGLPVLDHKVYLLVVFSAVRVRHRYFLTTRGAFGGWRIWPPNAPHILEHMSIVFRKFIEIFSSKYGGRDKKKEQKRAEIWALKSFRDRSKMILEAVDKGG